MNQLNIHISEVGLIISQDLIARQHIDSLEASYKKIAFQLLCDKPVLCVYVDNPSYPSLFPCTAIVTESKWSKLKNPHNGVLINNAFFVARFDKTAVDVNFTDLLEVFDMLTDSDELTAFSDEHGLLIGGATK